MNNRFVEDLKNRINLVEIVQKYAELKKSGKNYMCRSPFRNERTPSFSVSPERQFWYDFGAGEGGDVISFIEKIENINFQEAVEFLASMNGLEVPKNFGQNKKTVKEKKDIFQLHEVANEYFCDQLKNNSDAQEYLKNRKISQETIKNWAIGFGGMTKDGLSKFLLSKGFSEKQISDSGVAFERSFGDKKIKDRFDSRIIVPICEPRDGKIIAFSGREIFGKKNVGKYINSPENSVYHKSSTLMGFDRAKKIISEKDFVILVEGNFDVIAAHSVGHKNTVATCGTSLTEDHLRILKRWTKNIYFAFDSDLAGKKAIIRGTEMALKFELNPFIVEIIDGKDIDDLVQKNPEKLQKLIDEAPPALEFFLDKFGQKYLDNTIDGEKKFLDAYFFLLKLCGRPIEIDDFLQKIAQKIQRNKNIIEQEFQKFCLKNKQKPKFVKETKIKKFSREEYFVGFLFCFWDTFGDKLNEKILEIFCEETPKKILQKKLNQENFSEEEKALANSWEISQSNLYHENISADVLKTDFSLFLEKIKNEKIKLQRLENARQLKI